MAMLTASEILGNWNFTPSTSMFVDTFIDHVVGGQIIGPHPIRPAPPQNRSNRGWGRSARNEETQDDSGSPTILPAAKRLIAIGDCHGDLKKTKEALQIAKVMDRDGRWIGGETVVVQVGDILDRGGSEIKILYLLDKLKRQARRAGGEVHILNGNHEFISAAGDFHYASVDGVLEFQEWARWFKMGNVLKERCLGMQKPRDFFQNLPFKPNDTDFESRYAALRPGGPLAIRFLAPRPVVLIIGASVFVHGGVLAEHVDIGLDKINKQSREWLEGKFHWREASKWPKPDATETERALERSALHLPETLCGSSSVVWTRKFSGETKCDCKELEESLKKIPGAKRMVMGHTVQIQAGINTMCNEQAVRVDVGMSIGCNNKAPQVLEIKDDSTMSIHSALPADKVMDNLLGLAALLAPNNLHIRVPNLDGVCGRKEFQEQVLPTKTNLRQTTDDQNKINMKFKIILGNNARPTRIEASAPPPPRPPIRLVVKMRKPEKDEEQDEDEEET